MERTPALKSNFKRAVVRTAVLSNVGVGGVGSTIRCPHCGNMNTHNLLQGGGRKSCTALSEHGCPGYNLIFAIGACIATHARHVRHAQPATTANNAEVHVRKGAHCIGKVELLASPSAESTGAVAPTLERRDSIGRMDTADAMRRPRRTTTIQSPVPGH